MAATPSRDLPYLQPSQAQKHVTHNEALQRLDILVQLKVQGFDAIQPPALPQEGDVFVTGTGAQADWAGQDERIAAFTGGAWLFIEPQEGWRATDAGNGAQRVFQGGAWVAPPLENLAGLGINTIPDATNRLALASDASLLSHDGGGHQVKVNKAAAGDTASLLFQSGWTGHAEMGLAGDTDFSVKVSADGTTWSDAMVIDKDTGDVTVPALSITGTAGEYQAFRMMHGADYGGGFNFQRVGGTEFVGLSGFDTGNRKLLTFGGGGWGVHDANEIIFYTDPNQPTNGPDGGPARMRIVNNGNVAIGPGVPTARLDVDGDTMRLRSAKTPASASAAGTTGEICWDANYVYVCVGADTWKRAALASW